MKKNKNNQKYNPNTNQEVQVKKEIKNYHRQNREFSPQKINTKKILLIPGEEYPFNRNLLHYDSFGYNNSSLISKKCGILLCGAQELNEKEEDRELFKSLGRYYSPKTEDFVIGTIVQKSSEFYKVDIGTYSYAMLHTSEFEGATKKTKPNLNLGDIVFARVLKCNKFDSPILSCKSLHETKNWASGETFFGNLKEGNVFKFNKIDLWSLMKDNYALNRLNDVVSFEIVFGFNGKMWINSVGEKGSNYEDIFNIYNILIASLSKSKEEIEKIIHETFIDKLK